MNQQPIIWISEWTLIVTVCVGLIFILFGTIYDIQSVARRRVFRKIVKSQKPYRPHITVLVYVKNNASLIEACLTSIRKNRYRKYDVVVVNNKSTDASKSVIGSYKKSHPKSPLYVYEKRKVSDRHTALLQGYRASLKGDIILVLDGDNEILPTVLRQSAMRFTGDVRLRALRLNEFSSDIYGINLLSRRFLQLSRSVYMKFFSIFSIRRKTIMQSGILYRKSVFKTLKHNQRLSYRYDGSIAAITQSPRDNTVPTIFVFFGLVLMTYFMYIAATLQNSSLLVFSWTIVSVWLLFTAWSDEVSSVRQKIALSFCIPAFYFLLYLQIAARVLARSIQFVVRTTS